MNTATVEPHYVGYLKLPAISNRIGFPLDLPLLFQSFHGNESKVGNSNESKVRLTGLCCCESKKQQVAGIW